MDQEKQLRKQRYVAQLLQKPQLRPQHPQSPTGFGSSFMVGNHVPIVLLVGLVVYLLPNGIHQSFHLGLRV